MEIDQASGSGASSKGGRTPPSSRGTTPLARLSPIIEEGTDMADEQSARRAWDPSHTSAQVERQVKIRACLDLATVLLRVPSAYRGVLSDLFAKYTDKVEQRDQLTRAKSKLERLHAKGEIPYSYNSLKLPTIQYQKGSHDLWKETWSLPAEDNLKKLKKILMEQEHQLLIKQIERINGALDEKEAVKEGWEALRECYERRPKHDHYKVVLPQGGASGTWPNVETLAVADHNDLYNELQALQVDLPCYFRKVYDLKMDLIERTHGREEKKVAEKRSVDVEMKDVASSATKQTLETINREVQRQVAAALKGHIAPGIAPPPKVSRKTSGVHQNPTHSISLVRPVSEEGEEVGEGLQRGQEGEGGPKGLHQTLSQGGNFGEETPSWRRQRSQEEWALRRTKREEEAAVEVLKRKPWTFGVPSSYPDELLLLPHSRQATVLLSRAPISLLDANRFRSPVHVQPMLEVPMAIQHDLSASLKFMFEGPLQVAVRWAESVGTRLVTSQWRHIQIVPEHPKGWTTPLVAFVSRWAIRVGAGSWLRPHTEPPC